MKRPLIHRLLVPVDLSKRESGLRDYAIAMGKQLGAEILFFAVIDSPTMLHLIESHPSEAKAQEGFRTKLVADAKVLLKRIVDRAGESSVRATGHAVVSEKVHREVIREARERNVDVILVGTEDHSTLWRLLLGDSAEEIMHRAPCPVLAVKAMVKTKGR